MLGALVGRTRGSQAIQLEPGQDLPAVSKQKAVTEPKRHDGRRAQKLLQGPDGKRKLGALGKASGATLALHRPKVDGVQELVRGIERALDASQDQAAILAAVSKSVAKLVADPKAIDDALIRTSNERYTRTLLHRDPAQRFIVLLLAWAPGQASPIHDHECWGAVGVLRGTLAETRYDQQADGSLAAGASQLAKRGSVTTVDPPETDLHTMSNPTRDVTVTIHVYGRDMTEANVYDAQTGEKTRKQIKVDYEA